MGAHGGKPEVFAGMTLSIMGDSISTFEGWVPAENAVYYTGERCAGTGVLSVGDTWWGILMERLGLRLFKNGSYSGSLVCGPGFPFGASKARAAQLVAPDTWPDLVIVFMGINDYGCGVAGGIERFRADYHQLLGNVREACPDARVLACTLLPGRVAGVEVPTFCTQLRGVDICAFNDCIRAAARDADCDCLDVASFGFDYETTDGTHPNARGMEQIATMMEAWLENRPETVFANEELFPHWLRSSRTCERPTCIGCEYAEDTSLASWSCICNKLHH